MKTALLLFVLVTILANSSISQCVTNAGPDKVICPGPGSIQIGTPPQPQTSYSWLPTSALSNPSISNPIASPLTTTTYTLRTITNLVANGDFEQGNIGFTSDYTGIMSNYQGGVGTYTIGSNPNTYVGPWCNTRNHTPGGNNMMIVDGLRYFQTNNVVWSQTINVLPNFTYDFSLWLLSTGNLNYDPFWPLIEIRVNGTVIHPNATIPLPYSRNCPWTNFVFPLNVGNLTTATIEIRTLTFSGYSGGNDFAIDDIEILCKSEDQVTVQVCPSCFQFGITPAGPIEYYIPNDYSVLGGFTLTSNMPVGNQWYRNGVVISGATGQTYTIPRGYSHLSTSEIYSCRAYGCTSNNVTVTYKHYGYGNFGEENMDFGAKIFPSGGSNYFCRNTANNPIKQFNQGPNANYYWNLITTPTEGTPYISLTPGSTNIHSNVAQINIANPVLTNSPYFTNYDFVQGVSDLNGSLKIIDLAFEVTPRFYAPYGPGYYSVCASQTYNIKASDYFYNTRQPGTTLFDWEEYDFGPNSVIISPNPAAYPVPSDPTNIHKIRLPGRNMFTGNILVKFTGNTQIKRNYYYNSPDNGCYNEVVDVVVNFGCRSDLEDGNSVIVYPNPAASFVFFESLEKNSTILSVEVWDKFNIPVRKVANKNSGKLEVNISDLKEGIYFCFVQTSKGNLVKKLIIGR